MLKNVQDSLFPPPSALNLVERGSHCFPTYSLKQETRVCSSDVPVRSAFPREMEERCAGHIVPLVEGSVTSIGCFFS